MGFKDGEDGPIYKVEFYTQDLDILKFIPEFYYVTKLEMTNE